MSPPTTCDEMRTVVRKFFSNSNVPSAEKGKFWDLMAMVRGPDYPSERGTLSPDDYKAAYAARRQRKRETVEVIRHKLFDGMVGGTARHREGDCVILPPSSKWDHFDRHVQRAALILGLRIETK